MTIDPSLPLWLIVVLLTGLLTWSIVIEWRRSVRFKLLRITACAIAALALAVIFLRPSRPVISNKQAIVLTPSFSPTVVDSLLRTHREVGLYHLDGTGHRSSRQLSSYRKLFPGAGPIHNMDPATGEPVGRIEAIAGDGLPAFALDSIAGGFLYLPSKLPDGITSLLQPSQHLQRNRPAILTGTYLTSTVPATLYFSDPAGKLDSTQLTSNTGSFSFAFTPRASGRMSYALTLTDSTGSHIRETVPFIVDDFAPLNIFMLQDYPTFEMQHLKNFLSDRGHRIAVRARLSRDTYRTEFVNHAPTSLERLTPILPDAFDLLVVDAPALSHLTTSERSTLVRALQNGLGMIVVFNGVPDKYPARELLPVTFSNVSVDTTSIIIHGKRVALPATRLKPTSFVGTTLAKDASRTLSGYTSIREGVTGFQLLRETYSILLSGDSASYGSIWSPLIDATARPRQRTHAIRMTREFPLQTDEPISIEVISESTPELFADSVQVPVGEDPLIDGLWHATVWADDAGWHNLRTLNDTLSYYVFGRDDWKALRLTQQQQANKIAAGRPSRDLAQAKVVTPVSLLPFWIAFMIAVGFLWLAPKL